LIPDNYDFHLRAGDSAARGYGANLRNDANLAFSDDIDGESRPENGAWDIGADQVARTTQINTSLKGRGPTEGLVGYWTFDGTLFGVQKLLALPLMLAVMEITELYKICRVHLRPRPALVAKP
jgi:hypothetical protein